MTAEDRERRAGSGRRFPLRDELYFIAHDDETGRPVAHLPSLNVGLAGAIVLDLYLAGRVRLDHDYLVIQDPRPCSDAVADHAVAALAAREYARLAPWLRWLADGLYDSLTRYLLATGVLTAVRERRLGILPVTRARPADRAYPTLARGPARTAVLRPGEAPDAASAALCGLIRVLNLESALYLAIPGPELRDRLGKAARRGDRGALRVITTVEALVGEVAVAVYR